MVRLPITRSGVVVSRWLAWLLVGVLSIGLWLSTGLSTARAETPSPAPTPAEAQAARVAAADSDGDGSPDRPDEASAAVLAGELGVAVEDLSRRTESVRVVIDPDGSATREVFAGPMWVKNGAGVWVDVDYTLVRRPEGGFAPKAAPTSGSVVIDGGGAKEFARMDLPGGGSMIWSWPEALPAPSVAGPRATYAVADGVDLLVTATGKGVSTRIRINSPVAVRPDFTVQVRTEGVDLEQSDAGQLFFDDGGDPAAHTSSMMAWDARLDAFGDPVETVPVDASLAETGSSGELTDQDLTLTTPDELVSDPNVEYPITIDPDVTSLLPSQDTWVREDTTWIEGSFRLMVGRLVDSPNDHATISYIQWPDNSPSGWISGRTVTSATLSLFQYAAGSCSSRRMNIHPLSQAWSETTALYSNKPTANTTSGTSTYLTKNVGGDGCSAANGYVTADVTDMVAAWGKGPSGGGLSNYGMQLNVPSDNASDVTYERRFCSANPDPDHTSCTTAQRSPSLSFKYSPLAPQQPQLLSVGQLKSAGVTWSPTPTLSAKLLLAAGERCATTSCLRGEFTVKNAAGTPVATLTSAAVANGGTASVVVSPALLNLSGYTVSVRSFSTDVTTTPQLYSPESTVTFTTDIKPASATELTVYKSTGVAATGTPPVVSTDKPGLSARLPGGQYCPGTDPACLSAVFEVWSGSNRLYSASAGGRPGDVVVVTPTAAIVTGDGLYTLKVRVKHSVTAQESGTTSLAFEKTSPFLIPLISGLAATDGNTRFTVQVDNPDPRATSYTWTTVFTADSEAEPVIVEGLQLDSNSHLSVNWAPVVSGLVSVRITAVYPSTRLVSDELSMWLDVETVG